MTSPLELKLESLKNKGIIKNYNFVSQVPTCDDLDESRLIDKLYLTFPSGDTLNLTTFCSGHLENTTLDLNDES
jgi:hypothetical protein